MRILSANEITLAWLTECLHKGGHLPKGWVTGIKQGKTFSTHAAFFTPLNITYSADTPDAAPQHLIYKVIGLDRNPGSIAEISFYTSFAPMMDAPFVPICYAHAETADGSAAYMLLENVAYTHFKLRPTLRFGEPSQAQLEQVVDTVAAFESFWWGHPRLQENYFLHPHGGPFLAAQAGSEETIRGNVAQFAQVLPKTMAIMGSDMVPAWRTIYEQTIDRWADLLIRRVNGQLPLTLNHGDLHLWNIFFPKSPEDSRIRILDWETYRRGLPTGDIAYLLIFSIVSSSRQTFEKPLLKRYHQGLLDHGIENYTWDNCLQDYRLSVLANLFPALYWEGSWRMIRAMTAFEDWSCAELLTS